MGGRRPAIRWGRYAGVAAIAASVVLAGCGGSSGDAEPGDAAAELTDLDDADSGAEPSVDRRPAILSELGSPDSFLITVDEIDGVVSRFESWTYYAAQTQIDFIDGELLWDMEIEGLPEGSWLPITFSPSEFTMLATFDETRAALGDVALTEVDATDTEVEGGSLWAGPQLLLGFVDDALVYVETFAAAPVEPEVVP